MVRRYWTAIALVMAIEIMKSSQVGFPKSVSQLMATCNLGQCDLEKFIESAPCPPPGKLYRLCNIKCELSCSERTRILKSCSLETDKENVNKSIEKCLNFLYCNEFKEYCAMYLSRLQCGILDFKPTTPSSSSLPITTTRLRTSSSASKSTLEPSINSTLESSINVTDSKEMNISDYTDTNNTNKYPKEPKGTEVTNASLYYLLFLLILPILACVLCVFVCRRRQTKQKNGNKFPCSETRSTFAENVEKENIITTEEKHISSPEHRKSIGDELELENVPFIDESPES